MKAPAGLSAKTGPAGWRMADTIAATPRDPWGRSIPKMEAELAAARAELDAAAAKTRAALDAVDAARTDAAELRAWTAWNKAHDAQNRAAQRLHAANRALGRPPRA